MANDQKTPSAQPKESTAAAQSSAIGSQFYFVQGRTIRTTLQGQCKANGGLYKTVFIFPGNTGHHGDGNTLYAIKGGGGLAALAQSFGERGQPVLSLPTTRMTLLKEGDPIPDLAQKAVGDLWAAVGAGYNLALPVRKPMLDAEGKEGKYFSSTFENGLEPSFWGNIENDPNKWLGDYYLAKLEKIRKYISSKREEDIPAEFLDAFNRSHSNAEKDIKWFARPPFSLRYEVWYKIFDARLEGDDNVAFALPLKKTPVASAAVATESEELAAAESSTIDTNAAAIIALQAALETYVDLRKERAGKHDEYRGGCLGMSFGKSLKAKFAAVEFLQQNLKDLDCGTFDKLLKAVPREVRGIIDQGQLKECLTQAYKKLALEATPGRSSSVNQRY